MGKDLEGSSQCLLKYYASSHLEGKGEPAKILCKDFSTTSYHW
jgi:hypothetical protein